MAKKPNKNKMKVTASELQFMTQYCAAMVRGAKEGANNSRDIREKYHNLILKPGIDKLHQKLSIRLIKYRYQDYNMILTASEAALFLYFRINQEDVNDVQGAFLVRLLAYCEQIIINHKIV